MARVTPNDVQDVLGRNYDPNVDLCVFISSATVVVDRVEQCAIKKGTPLTAAELKQIESLLTAHFYGSADQFYMSRSTGKASGSFRGQSGLGLEGSLYGQNAMLVDYSGCLEAIDKNRRVDMKWLGKPKSKQIPITERD